MVKTCTGTSPSKVSWKIIIETLAVHTLLYRKTLKTGKIIHVSSACLQECHWVGVVQP